MRHRPIRNNYPTGKFGDIDYQERLERYCTYLENKNKALTEQCNIANVSARLSSSLGECVEGNDYEIVADKDGRFWINHKEVGSGEPLEQWIDSVLNVR
jgi:hypothetical protein